MAEELKIRIPDYRKAEAGLLKLGARFLGEISVKDTYYIQPKGEVLKITEDDKGDFLVRLKLKDGKFGIVKYEPVKGVEAEKGALAEKFGVKCVLRKKRRFFDFGGYGININLIEGVGEFLILEGEDLKREMISGMLKIENPEFVTVSFDELAVKKKEG